MDSIIQCPICASYHVETRLEADEYTAKGGMPVLIKLVVNKCLKCSEEGDFEAKNDVVITEARERSLDLQIQKKLLLSILPPEEDYIPVMPDNNWSDVGTPFKTRGKIGK